MKIDPIVISTFLISVLLPWIQQIINVRFKLDGPRALLLTAGLAALVSLGSLFASGDLTTSQLTIQNFAVVFAQVFTLTQITFQSLKDKLFTN